MCVIYWGKYLLKGIFADLLLRADMLAQALDAVGRILDVKHVGVGFPASHKLDYMMGDAAAFRGHCAANS